jgi:hypothetical protein
VRSVTGGWNKLEDEEEEEDEDEEVLEVKKQEEEKKSLKEKMQQMQEITLMVQNILGLVAHIIESVANVFNFCVPFLSWLGFTVLCIVTVVLYNVPLRYEKNIYLTTLTLLIEAFHICLSIDIQKSSLFRYLIMAWGTNKFLKKLVKPNAISNNELADFISRVPDNEELVSTIQCCVINKTESICDHFSDFKFCIWYDFFCRKTFKNFLRQRMLRKQSFSQKRSPLRMQKSFNITVIECIGMYNTCEMDVMRV